MIDSPVIKLCTFVVNFKIVAAKTWHDINEDNNDKFAGELFFKSLNLFHFKRLVSSFPTQFGCKCERKFIILLAEFLLLWLARQADIKSIKLVIKYKLLKLTSYTNLRAEKYLVFYFVCMNSVTTALLKRELTLIKWTILQNSCSNCSFASEIFSGLSNMFQDRTGDSAHYCVSACLPSACKYWVLRQRSLKQLLLAGADGGAVEGNYVSS